MRTLSGALTTHLASGLPLVKANLYTLTLYPSAAVLRWAISDRDVVYGGFTFKRPGVNVPAIERGPIRWQSGLEVDTVDMTLRAAGVILPLSSLGIGNDTPLVQAAALGILDGANVKIDRVFLLPTGAWDGATLGTFNVSEVKPTGRAVALRLKSELELLDRPLPRNVYQTACGNALYDAQCAVNKATFAVSGTTLSGGTQLQITFSDAHATGYFDLGFIVWTSGQNNGYRATVKAHTNAASVSTLQFALPQFAVPGTGDTFTAYPGCDRKQATCSTKFSNLDRFRGFPYIPLPKAPAPTGGTRPPVPQPRPGSPPTQIP